MTTYRVRRLDMPIMLYRGMSFTLASRVMDEEAGARIMEHLAQDGWRTVVCVVPARPC